MPVKERMSFKSVFGRKKPTVQNGIVWHVKVKDVKGLDMAFDIRQDAREYKRLLARGRSKLQAVIVAHHFMDGFLVDEEVS